MSSAFVCLTRKDGTVICVRKAAIVCVAPGGHPDESFVDFNADGSGAYVKGDVLSVSAKLKEAT